MKNTIPRSTVSDFLGNIPATPELTQQKSKAAVSQEDPGPAAKPSELESQSCREEPASNDFKSSARTGAPAKRAGWEAEMQETGRRSVSAGPGKRITLSVSLKEYASLTKLAADDTLASIETGGPAVTVSDLIKNMVKERLEQRNQ